MEALILLLFLSAVLVASAVGLFAWTVRERTFEHSERLALLPLREDAAVARVRHGNAALASPSSSDVDLPSGTEPVEARGQR